MFYSTPQEAVFKALGVDIHDFDTADDGILALHILTYFRERIKAEYYCGHISANGDYPENGLCHIPLHGKSAKHIPDINLMLSFHVEAVIMMTYCGQKEK